MAHEAGTFDGSRKSAHDWAFTSFSQAMAWFMATTGFTLSPLMARLLAESMATGRTTLPPTYDVDRAGGHPIPT